MGATPFNKNNTASRPPPLPDVDSLIANEMNRMSVQDRESVLDELHGIAALIDENPDIVQQALMDMNHHLEQIQMGTAYEEAMSQNAMYVQNSEFQLMFLRAERFQAPDAAERMIRFYELKQQLFGADKLVKDITLEDLNEDDLECLLQGGCGEVSPYKDTAGRHIVTYLTGQRKYKVPENVMRATYYVLMSVMESKDAQKRGIVTIHYNVDTKKMQSVTSNLRGCLPVHFAGLHVCLNDNDEYIRAVSVAIRQLVTKDRVRFRVHWGSHVECQYQLASFGIPKIALPISPLGKPVYKDHLAWIEKRREIEAARMMMMMMMTPNTATPAATTTTTTTTTTTFGGVQEDGNNTTAQKKVMTEQQPPQQESQFLMYSPDDVLFGRGKIEVEHPGNTRFRQLVDAFGIKYIKGDRMDKTIIAETIVQMIKSSSGRFLKREENNSDSSWVQVDDITARKKVAHAFRNRRKFHES